MIKDTKRRTDSSKMLWHMDRVHAYFDRGERIAPIYIDMGLTKTCNMRCVYCLASNTKILMADFTWKDIADVQVGDMVIGFDEDHIKLSDNEHIGYFQTKVTEVFKRVGRTYKLSGGDTSIRITKEHPILCKGHRWRDIRKLKDGDLVRFFYAPYETNFKENYLYKLGYVKGIMEGDGTICTAFDKRDTKNNYRFRKFKLQMDDLEAIDRTKKYVKDLFDIDLSRSQDRIIRTDKVGEVDLLEEALKFRIKTDFSLYPKDFSRGYLAGIFDAEGSLSDRCLRISQKKSDVVEDHIKQALIRWEFTFRDKDGGKGFRLLGGNSEIARFFGQCKPAITRKANYLYSYRIPSTVSITKGDGITEDVYNFETESHTYVANGFCVHNCYGVYQNLTGEHIRPDVLVKLFNDAPLLGVKGIGAIGDGEPTLNPGLYDALDAGAKNGLKMAVSTNGLLLKDEGHLDNVIRNCTWMRFNLSAGTREGYKKIHGVDAFERLVAIVRRAVQLKKERGYKCDIGLQAVFVPWLMNDEVVAEAELAVALGVDYLLIKQCSLPVNNISVNEVSFNTEDSTHPDVVKALKTAESLAVPGTDITIKWVHMLMQQSMTKTGHRDYDGCLAPPFLLQISGNGKIYPCGHLFGREKYLMGDLHTASFGEIITSDKYWEVIEQMKTFDVHNDCHGQCRHDKINEFLYEYIHPPLGIDFI